MRYGFKAASLKTVAPNFCHLLVRVSFVHLLVRSVPFPPRSLLVFTDFGTKINHIVRGISSDKNSLLDTLKILNESLASINAICIQSIIFHLLLESAAQRYASVIAPGLYRHLTMVAYIWTAPPISLFLESHFKGDR